MLQFELNFVDLSLGYPLLYLIASTKNSVPYDGGDKGWIWVLVRACSICLVLRRNNSPKSCAARVCDSNNVSSFEGFRRGEELMRHRVYDFVMRLIFTALSRKHLNNRPGFGSRFF